MNTIPKFPKFLNWLEALFYYSKSRPYAYGAPSPAKEASGFRVVSFKDYPEEYTSFVKTLSAIQEEGGSEVLLKKLSAANLELQLEPLDWLRIYTENKKFKQLMIFPVNLESLSAMDADSMGKYLERAIKASLDVNFMDNSALMGFLQNCIDVNIVAFAGSVKNRHITLKSVIEVFDFVIGISPHKDSIKKYKEIQNNLRFLLTTSAHASLDDLVSSVQEKKSVFSPLEHKRQLAVNADLFGTIKEIKNKSKELEPELFEKVKLIASCAEKLIKNDWTNLTQEEKVTFKVTIEKDLPTLIFNYLSLPGNMRNNLVEKGTDISIVSMLSSSFDKIHQDFLAMDKTQEKLDTSLNQIKSTTKYLHSRG